MKKPVCILIAIFSIVCCSLTGCVGNAEVPDEIISTWVNRNITKEYDPSNSEVIWDASHDTRVKGKDVVTLEVSASSEVCTREIEVKCQYELVGEKWKLKDSNQIIKSTDWNLNNLIGAWWIGGAGLNYRAFYVKSIDEVNKKMDIIDMNGREYSADYDVSDYGVSVYIKYDIASWYIRPNGPSFNGYLMSKQ